MRWFEKHRQDWIAETIHIFGFIRREHICKKFDISVPQASKDLQQFMKDHPSALEYDKSNKCYVEQIPF